MAVDVPAINLVAKGHPLICFAAAHSAVIYDFENGVMEHLSGHASISCYNQYLQIDKADT